MTIKGISLFSGCGGLDLGFERYNGLLNDKDKQSEYEIIWANDIDEFAVKSYAKNFNAEIYDKSDMIYDGGKKVYLGDVREVDFSKVLKGQEIDFILGGFPCQDFSVLRGSDKRKGIEVQRGKLYLEFVRSLEQLQPKVFVAENVKGIKSANDGLAFKQIIDDFQHLKQNWDDIKKYLQITYDINRNNLNNYKILFSEVVNFADHGVPQSRERLVIIGVREDLIKNTNRIEELKNQIYSTLVPEVKFPPLTPLEMFEGKVLTELQQAYDILIKKYEGYIRELGSERAEEYLNEVWPTYTFDIIKDYVINNKLYDDKQLNDIILQRHKNALIEVGAYQNTLNEDKKYPDGSNKVGRTNKSVIERLKRIPPGENHVFVKGTEHSVKGLMSNIYRRVHPLIPSPTIIANGGGGTWGYHYRIDRQALTNRERARL
ncbi:MAG: DNA cytosine methyltransferase, partial [bacterium]